MKLLLLNSEFPPLGGGAGNASAAIARELVGLGHEVVMLTARYGALPHEESWQGVRVLRVVPGRRQADRSGFSEQLGFILGGSLAARRLLKQFPAQAVLAFFGVPGGAIAWTLKKSHQLPYLVSMRGGDVPGFRPYDFALYHKLAGPFLKVIWHQAGRLVANSQGLRELALAFDPRVSIDLIPNGVDLQAYAPVPRTWEPVRLLSVGRLVHQKGLDLAAHALAGLTDLEWQWCIAGDGKARPELEALVKDLGIASRVTFLGWLDRPSLKQAYDQASLFLFPSRHEGMPNAVLEAMACGLPVVASRIAGNVELVEHGRNGLLVSSESVPELQAALRSLVTNGYQLQTMGAASRARVVERYSWRSTAEQYTKLLSQLLEAG